MTRQPFQSRHIEIFLHNPMDKGSAPKTAIVDVKAIGGALPRAERYGYIDKNPVPAVKLPKPVSTGREVFTLNEIHPLVKAAPDEDWQTLIMLGAFTGARLGDCLRLTWDNLVPQHKVPLFRQAKTDKDVMLPVHADLLIHLNRLSRTGTVGPLCRSLATRIKPASTVCQKDSSASSAAQESTSWS